MTLEWALAKAPDFIGDYVNALQAGRSLARPTPPPKDPAAAIAALDAQGRAGAARRAQIVGAVGIALKQAPYFQRRSILAHMAPDLAAHGLAADAVAAFDPTAANIDAQPAIAGSLAQSLADAPPPAGATAEAQPPASVTDL